MTNDSTSQAVPSPPLEQSAEDEPSGASTEETIVTEQNDHSIQGKALRSLVSSLTSENDLHEVNRHQASTLSQLVHVKQTLAIINKQTLDAYNDSAADFIRATRLAGQVKQNLDDISRRLALLKTTLATRQAGQVNKDQQTE